MFESAKFEYNECDMVHMLRFEPEKSFVERLIALAFSEQLKIAGLESAKLTDGEEDIWMVFSNSRNALVICEGIVTIWVPAEYDRLDGTDNNPVDEESSWVPFVPICRSLLALAA